MQSQQSRPRALVLTLVLSALVAALPSSRAEASTDPGEKRAQIRRERAQAAAQLDTLKAQQGEITAALGALNDNLDAQRSLAERAQEEESAAAAAAATARQAERAKQAEITQLETEARNLALGMYMGTASAGLEAFFPRGEVGDAIYQRAMSELVLGGAESSLDALDTARQDLADVRNRAEDAQAEAAHRKEHAEQQSRQLAEAMALAEQKQAELDDRVDQNLAEAASLAELDSRLSREIAAREVAIAAELRKSQDRLRAQSAPTNGSSGSRSGGGLTVRPTTGRLATVGGVTVDVSIADALSRLMAAARADGFNLGGGGYRSAEAQISVRRNNCGPTEYDIWQKPASQCRPPAARPGTSMHERGLAIDFTCNGALIGSYDSSCYAWFQANAPTFGFRNRPGEAWHWSPNGN